MSPKLANFVRATELLWEFDIDILPTYAWYGACTALSAVMLTKPPSTYSEADRNWQWPEKTWFQERLNSIKAKEHEQRRKPEPTSTKHDLGAAGALGTEPLKVD
ncbi:MAG: hypothetical protein ACREPG_09785 [Candidatus Binatia bacterium]